MAKVMTQLAERKARLLAARVEHVETARQSAAEYGSSITALVALGYDVRIKLSKYGLNRPDSFRVRLHDGTQFGTSAGIETFGRTIESAALDAHSLLLANRGRLA